MNPPSPDSVPAVRTGERAWAALAILSVIVLVAGCAPTVVFYGDSAYLAAIVNTDDFESRMERAAADAGQRLVTEWDPSDALATAWLEQSLDEPVAPIVVLSPYFSLFASDVAARYPDISVIAMGGEVSQQANLTRVTFDRVPAFERAGALVRDWVSAGDDRGAGVLYLANSESRRAGLDALREGYGGEGSDALRVLRYDSTPDREELRRAVRDLRGEGVNAFLVFVGSSNRFALELLQSEPVVFATDGATGLASLADSLLFSVEDKLAHGLSVALEAIAIGAGGGTLVADSSVEVGDGFSRPQLFVVPSEDPEVAPIE